MDYPQLLLAIRSSGRPQYAVARAAGIREGRLSEIVRRGAATPAERRALSQALRVPQSRLFGRHARSPHASSRAQGPLAPVRQATEPAQVSTRR